MELLLTLGTTSLAGCALPLEKDQKGQNPGGSTSGDETPSDTPTDTEQPEPETGWIRFEKPEDAEDSPIYDLLDPTTQQGVTEEDVITHKVAIEEAMQWKKDDWNHWAEVKKDEGLLENEQEYEEFKNLPELIQTEEGVNKIIEKFTQNTPYDASQALDFSWSDYSGDGSFQERAYKSNFIRAEGQKGFGFRYTALMAYIGGINSTDNELEEGFIFATEQEAGKTDNYTIAHQTTDIDHGIITFVENATYDENDFDQQNVGVTETESGESRQIIQDITDLNGEDTHPAESGERMGHVYGKIMANTDREDGAPIEIATDEEENFRQALLNPSEHSLAYYRDKAAVAMDLAMSEEYQDNEIRIETEGIKVV
jgi:hypothetical protein